MGRPFSAVPITDRVYWVGAIDWGIRNFHGYATRRGTTYNAYLVLADRVTLIDTVKAPFKDELLSRIASVVDPQDVSLIVSNHSEMDHSGSLPDVIEALRPETVVASVMGVKTLGRHFHGVSDVVEVKDGESLSLGGVSLSFLETRMLHWPDSMFSYLPEEELLFSQDAFGMHLASSAVFDDEIEDSLLLEEAAKYYANILLPFSPLVAKLLTRVEELGLRPKIVAPDHGPVWRRSFGTILGRYAKWSLQEPTRKAVVAYDTMWGSTDKMARAIADGLAEGGATVKLVPLSASHRSDVASEILDAGALLIGTPTMNNEMFPTVADLLTYLKGLKPRNLIGCAFGSYGWSGEAVGKASEMLGSMGVELVADDLRCQYVPDEAMLGECRSLGVSVAGRLVERAAT
jgi:flavorubredoxin